MFVRCVLLGLSQDGVCTDLVENLSENSLKGDLSNANTFNPPLVSLVNTFKNGERCGAKIVDRLALAATALKVRNRAATKCGEKK